MAITRWDPLAELTTMERSFDRLLSRLARPWGTTGLENAVWMPTTDVMVRGEDLVIKAELPGVTEKDVDISVTGNVLTISGQRKEERETEEGGYMMRESFRGNFQRSMTLPEGIDPSKMQASFRDGVLEVTVPKAAAMTETRTHHIPLQGGTAGEQRQMGAEAGRQETGQPGAVEQRQQGYQQQGATGQQTEGGMTGHYAQPPSMGTPAQQQQAGTQGGMPQQSPTSSQQQAGQGGLQGLSADQQRAMASGAQPQPGQGDLSGPDAERLRMEAQQQQRTGHDTEAERLRSE